MTARQTEIKTNLCTELHERREGKTPHSIGDGERKERTEKNECAKSHGLPKKLNLRQKRK